MLITLFCSVLTGLIVFLILRNISVSKHENLKNELNTTIALNSALKRTEKKLEFIINEERKQKCHYQETEIQLRTENIFLNERLEAECNNHTKLKEQEKTLQIEINSLSSELVKLESYNNVLHDKLELQNQEFKEVKEKSLLEFENIANKLFEEKTNSFSKKSKESLEHLINPLKENINDFKKKVEETYDKESKQRFSLESKIKELVDLNQQISKDASNLTNALKGQAKTQGDWGEMILENILEHSGLVKDREYFLQESYLDANVKRKQPDVTIKYPGGRHLIIDSKVSLTAYERFANSNEIAEQKTHLECHLKSIKSHVDDLSSKEYDSVDKSLDFVMLFVPIEPAYLTAIQYDPELWNYAYKQRILLISPTNLIASLKMVVDLWKRENQNVNAKKIAKRGEILYDKFAGFISDMENIGAQVNKLNGTYDKAFSKLSQGQGNLIMQAEELKKLGVSSKKQLPKKYLDDN